MNASAKSAADLLDNVLAILSIQDEKQRSEMIGKVNLLIQYKAGQTMLAALPLATQERLSALEPEELKAALSQELPADAINSAVQTAAAVIVPPYIFELSQIGTPDQQEAIKKLIAGVV